MATRAIERAVNEVPGIGDAGMRVGRAIHAAVQGSEPARDVADVLHGTWLGHPFHPVLTDITIGAWVLGGAFDLIGAVTGDAFAERAGDVLVATGTAAAVPTALAGLADFSTAPQGTETPATLHGLLNTASLALYVQSLRDRGAGRRGRGLAFSGVALGLAVASAWLGGHLVYDHKIGVDHGEDFDGPEDWTAILDAGELEDGVPARAEHDGGTIMVLRHGDELHAIGDVCSHAAGPLHEGRLDGWCVECPWHHSVFDVRDGSIVHGPATRPQAAFDARLRDGRVEVRLRR